MAKIGNLQADLTLNSTSFNNHLAKATTNLKSSSARMNKSLAKAGRGFDKLSKRVKGMASGMLRLNPAIATLAGGAGLMLLVKRSLDTADAIAKVADKVGLTTDQLQELRYAADIAGVGQTTLDMAMQRLSRRLGEVAQGQGELLGVAKQYGVQLRDGEGRMRSNMAVLKDFANVINNAESEQERLRISFKLFDSEGAALVNMMRNGGDAIDATRQQAQAMGLVIREDLIRGAEDAKNKMTLLGTVLDAKVTAAVVELAPKIGQLADNIVESLPKIMEFVDAVGQVLGLWDAAAADRMALVVMEIRELNQELSGLEALSGSTDDIFSGAQSIAEIEALRGKIEALEFEYQTLAGAVRDANIELAKTPVSSTSAGGGSSVPPPLPQLPKTYKTGPGEGSFRAAQNEKLAAGVDRLRRAQAGWNDEAQRIREALSPIEAYNAKVEDLNRLLRAGAIDQKTFDRAVANAGDEMETAQAKADALGDSIDGTLNDAFKNAVTGVGDWKQFTIRALQDVLFEMIKFESTAATLKTIFGFMSAGTGSSLGTQGSGTSTGWMGGGSTPAGGLPAPSMRQAASAMTAAAGPKGPTGTVYIDARGADRGGLELVAAAVREIDMNFEERAITAVAHHNATVIG